MYDLAADEAFQRKDRPEGEADRRARVKVAGRVMLLRDTGKLVWMNLRDQSGDLQIAVSKRDCSELGFELAKLSDLGDVLVAEGPVMRTRAGEVTVWASDLRPGAKSLLPPPAKHEGLQDPELRFRQRYVDLWANPEAADVLRLRSRLISRLRRFLDERGFVEVETPVLQTLAGGAAARPFVTHMNALDIDLFMRVAPELYLKRLLVGGMPRVYEVARNFRNEGVDRTHNPEFTMLEVYEAFGSYETMMELTESLVRELAQLAILHRRDRRNVQEAPADEDSLPAEIRITFGDHLVDYGEPFARVTYADHFRSVLGFEMTDRARVAQEVAARGLGRKFFGAGAAPSAEALAARVDHWLMVGALFDVAEERLDPSRPTFVVDYPAALCPLTREHPGDGDLAQRFELHIAGMEIANAYTELNDPDVQRARFEAQLSGVDDEEQTFRTLDEDFLRALKVGMPPAGGLGIGIDRLVMALSGQRSIRDVLCFPLMRPLPGA